jgi:DNA-binding GntR family transcriptional regulator
VYTADVKVKESKAQQAYREIRRMIFDGEFSANRRWSQRGISRRLGMSMVPVCEAVRRLEQQGLLQTKSRSGIRLRRLTPERRAEMLTFREAIEVQAVRLIVEQKRPKLGKLRRLGKQLAKYFREGKYHEAVNADCEFHCELVSLAGNSLMIEKFDELVLSLMSNSGWSDVSILAAREASSPSNHVGIVEALKSGSVKKAEKAIRDHIGTYRLK